MALRSILHGIREHKMNKTTPLHIMLVEDDEIDQECFKRLLKKTTIECHVTYAVNGQDAIDQLNNINHSHNQTLPDLMLVDINMPKINGFDLLKYIRSDEQYRSIPVLMLTTSDREKDIHDANKFQILGYCIKPLTKENLAAAIQSIPMKSN